MTILVQDQKTGRYFGAPGVWVATPIEAHEFLSWSDVLRTKQRHDLRDVQMIFRFDREGYRIEVPIERRPRWARKALGIQPAPGP